MTLSQIRRHVGGILLFPTLPFLLIKLIREAPDERDRMDDPEDDIVS